MTSNPAPAAHSSNMAKSMSLGTSAREGSVENLDPYLAKQKDFKESDFEKGSWFACTYNGKRLGLPWDSGSYAVQRAAA